MPKSESQLVNDAFTKDELENQIISHHLFPKPSITISRDPGSGGRPIARQVAKRLGFKFYDEELIVAIAKSAKRTKQIITDVDEKSRSGIQDLVHTLFNPEYISEATYLNHLINVVMSLAHQGNAVILGRGANFIVPKEKVLSVLITAPKNVRIERAAKFEKVTHKKAVKIVEKFSKERRDFVKQYFKKNYSDVNYYDLVINSEHLDLDRTSELIITAFRLKFPNVKIPRIVK
jgi:cytidylate kinase